MLQNRQITRIFKSIFLTMGLILTLSMCLSGCGTPSVNLNKAAAEYAPQDYQLILKQWTRKFEIYDYFVGQAFLSATWKSKEMRRAALSFYQDMYQIPPTDLEQRRALDASEDREYYDYFVSMTTHRQEWNNVADEDSQWRVTLVNQRSEEVVARSIEIMNCESVELQKMYPYIDAYSKCYKIRFPKIPTGRSTEFIPNNAGAVTLRFTGPVGQASMTWKVQ
jgi:hypothetical protein